MGAEEWLEASPRDRAEAARAELGQWQLAHWCADVLAGRVTIVNADEGEPDPRWLAASAWVNWGPASSWAERGLDYWPRVWAARTLLHSWHDDASRDVVAGLADAHWRVREMCAKVVARYEIGEAGDACARIVATDANHRARIAALRALAVVGESEHADAVVSSLSDDDDSVARQARMTVNAMEERLDREL